MASDFSHLNVLVGTWHLHHAVYKTHSAGQEIDYLGPNPSGMLVYDASGNMSVQMMRSNRSKWQSNDRAGGTGPEYMEAVQGYQAYFGAYTLHETEGYVIHHLKGCIYPNLEGSDQKRHYKLSHDDAHGWVLELLTDPIMLHGGPAVGSLTWHQAPQHS